MAPETPRPLRHFERGHRPGNVLGQLPLYGWDQDVPMGEYTEDPDGGRVTPRKWDGEVLGYLRSPGNGGAAECRIAEVLGMSRMQVRGSLTRLYELDLVTREAAGLSGAYLWTSKGAVRRSQRGEGR